MLLDNNSNSLEKKNSKLVFFSIGKCVEYLRSKSLPANHSTLVKYIGTKKSYHGFIFEYI